SGELITIRAVVCDGGRETGAAKIALNRRGGFPVIFDNDNVRLRRVLAPGRLSSIRGDACPIVGLTIS
ncbi:MAG: hypothetical protein JO135_08260, partial [Candidatus Eremiobacteraeota bacterium]|nr:hypothetical protein [Candidatus Eremiobacteraeota bacterium]